MKFTLSETAKSMIDNFERRCKNSGVNVRSAPAWKIRRLNNERCEDFSESGYKICAVGFSLNASTGEFENNSIQRAVEMIEKTVGSRKVWGHYTVQEFDRGNDDYVSVCFFYLNSGHPQEVWENFNAPKVALN